MSSPAAPDRGVLKSVAKMGFRFQLCALVLLVGGTGRCAPAAPTVIEEDSGVVVLRRDAARDAATNPVDVSLPSDTNVQPLLDGAILPAGDASVLVDRAATPDTFVVDVRAVVDTSPPATDTSVAPVDTSVTPLVDAGTHGVNRVGLSGTDPNSLMFDDVAPDHVGLPFIQRVAAYGILPRCSPTSNTFCPDRNATRREAAVAVTTAKFYGSQFMYRFEPYFTDVASSAVGFRQIQYMREAGVTTGCTESTFCPDRNVTRAEASVFVVRSLVGDTFTYSLDPYFDDVPTTHPHYRYMQKLRDLGITNGCATRQYCPDDPLPRWALAAFISRAFFPAPTDGGV